MANPCIFITSGICWSQTSACTPCLLSMQTFGYTQNKIPILGNGMTLMSGSRVQFSGMV